MKNKKIILIGMKACGKTTVGKILAQKLSVQFIELDAEIEKTHKNLKKEKFNCREIFKKYKEEYFRELETKTLDKLIKIFEKREFVLSCGGGTPLQSKNQKALKKMGKVIYLIPDKKALFERIIKNGIPAFFPYPDNPKRSFEELTNKREKVYRSVSDITLNCGTKSPMKIVNTILTRLN